jgi:glutamate-1-semialdehyde 2,1-aminomutase
MAAGIATLEILSQPGTYEKLERKGAYMAAGVAENLKTAGIRAVQNRVGSVSCLFFTRSPVTDFSSAVKANTKRFGEYFSRMLRGGIYLAPSQFEAAFISLAHTRADLDRTLKVQRRVLKKL